jgi:hypothetical protein
VGSLSYPARKAHAPRYTGIGCLFGSATFFHIIPKKERFSEKNIIEHETCVFIFLTNSAESFLILGRAE